MVINHFTVNWIKVITVFHRFACPRALRSLYLSYRTAFIKILFIFFTRPPPAVLQISRIRLGTILFFIRTYVSFASRPCLSGSRIDKTCDVKALRATTTAAAAAATIIVASRHFCRRRSDHGNAGVERALSSRLAGHAEFRVHPLFTTGRRRDGSTFLCKGWFKGRGAGWRLVQIMT